MLSNYIPQRVTPSFMENRFQILFTEKGDNTCVHANWVNIKCESLVNHN